jgi:hypothetical protein
MNLTEKEDIDLVKFLTMLSYQNLECNDINFIYYYYILILKYLKFIKRDNSIKLEEIYFTLLYDY